MAVQFWSEVNEEAVIKSLKTLSFGICTIFGTGGYMLSSFCKPISINFKSV
jgi:hypothetical protein